MRDKNNVFSMNRRLKGSIIGTVIEGMLSGCNFIVLYQVLEILLNGSTDFNKILFATAFAAVIFALRIAHEFNNQSTTAAFSASYF